MQTCCISIPYQIRLVFTCGRPIAPFSFLPAWYHNQIDGWLPAEVLFCLSPTLSLQDICSKHKRIDVSVVERDFIWKSPVDGLLELQNSTLNNKNTWLKEMEMIHLGNLSSFKPLEKKEKSVQGIGEWNILGSPEIIFVLCYLHYVLPYLCA